jgi:hypothetical protein
VESRSRRVFPESRVVMMMMMRRRRRRRRRTRVEEFIFYLK